jgi:hypothetical protein
MTPRKHLHLKFVLVLGLGALIALVLCVQCVRTYFYTDDVLIPQQADLEAERQVSALTGAARSSGVTNPDQLAPILERTVDAAGDRLLWMRVLNLDSKVFAQAGIPESPAEYPSQWWERVQKHQPAGTLVKTRTGKAFVVILPLRLGHPVHAPDPALTNHHARDASDTPHGATTFDWHNTYAVEMAIPVKAVAAAFEGLRQNLIVGVIAAIALLASLAMIGLRAPHYFRGKYLENELQLARRVQSDLQPKPHSVSPRIEFAASAAAVDHVGGDFYDVFEADSGRIAMVLGDVSGKGIPAALLVSVLQGAIRSSTAHDHELACESINRMLCERTACERFATLFWGVFDPATGMLRYVNAGHAAPMLVRHAQNNIERLDEGGPVLGLLPNACYSAGTVVVDAADMLILYTDGISETSNQEEQEFGEQRIEQMVANHSAASPAELCDRILSNVLAFGGGLPVQDDRTLMVVRFAQPDTAAPNYRSDHIDVPSVA